MPKKLTQEEFIRRANEIHNGRYDYSKVQYVNGTTPVIIICPEHGEFVQKPSSHLGGHGCRKCYDESLIGKNKYNRESFIEKARSVHGDKYDYSSVEFVNTYTPVAILCPIHGKFYQKPHDHFMYGCRLCGGRAKMDNESFIKAAKHTHGERYDYSTVDYVSSIKKVKIVCPKHGVFLQTPRSHIHGDGCPKCGIEKRKRLLFGVGFFDLYSENRSASYKAWIEMLRRCYDTTTTHKWGAYTEVTVCTEWHTYSKFKAWFENPENGYREGYHLDKDILSKENKIYSPETCCLIPPALNLCFTHHRKTNGLPLGVCFQKGKYVAQFSPQKKNGYIGRFETVEEAFDAYKEVRETYIKNLAISLYKNGEITKRVYEALMKYDLKISG